jgi:hypothetical protein
MSIADRPNAVPSRTNRATTPRLYPVYVDHLDIDPIHDMKLTVIAAADAPLGQIKVRLERGPLAPVTVDPTEYVNALRIFADHLEAHASDCDFAASLDREV